MPSWIRDLVLEKRLQHLKFTKSLTHLKRKILSKEDVMVSKNPNEIAFIAKWYNSWTSFKIA
jgi:hypothetical protein